MHRSVPQHHKPQRKTAPRRHLHQRRQVALSPHAVTASTRRTGVIGASIKRHATPYRSSRRFVSIFDVNQPEGILRTNDDLAASNDPMLQEQLMEGVSHGDIDLGNGKILASKRSALYNFVQYRVVEHSSMNYDQDKSAKLNSIFNAHQQTFGGTETDVNLFHTTRRLHPNDLAQRDEKQNVYYSFQQVYDDGNSDNDEPFIQLKTVIRRGSDNVSTLHLPSSASIVSAGLFNAYSPERVLYIGNWGGVLPQYFAKKLGTSVDIVDPDPISVHLSKHYSTGIYHHGTLPYANDDIEHPFDIAFDYAKLKTSQIISSTNNNDTNTSQIQEQEVADATFQLTLSQSIVEFQQSRERQQQTGKMQLIPGAIDFLSHLRGVYSQYYLADRRAIPNAIQFIQHDRHHQHMVAAQQKLDENIDVMIQDVFNVNDLFHLNRNHNLLQAQASQRELESEIEVLQNRFIALTSTEQQQSASAEEIAAKRDEISQEILVKQTKLQSVQTLTRSIASTPMSSQDKRQMVAQLRKWTSRILASLNTWNKAQNKHAIGSGIDSTTQIGTMYDFFDGIEAEFAPSFFKQFISRFLTVGDEFLTQHADFFADMKSSVEGAGHDIVEQQRVLRELYLSLNADGAMPAIWFETSFSALERYKKVLISEEQKHSELLQKVTVDETTLDILRNMHESLLDSIYLPTKVYDLIIHDHENDSPTMETLRFARQTLISESPDGDSNSISYGTFIRRCAVAAPHFYEQLDGIDQWIPDINQEAQRLKKVFAHVYWTQPSPDSVVFAATDSAIAADGEAHPVDPDRMTAIGVEVWQSQAIGLDVLAHSDMWHYIDDSEHSQDISRQLSYKMEDFIEKDE